MNKKKYSKYMLILVIVMLFVLPGVSAGAEEGVDFGDQVGYHPETGMVSFIGTNSDTPITVPQAQAAGMVPQDQAMAILQEYAPLFGEDNPTQNLVQIKFNDKTRGQVSYRYQQTYQGIPVFAGELVMNTTERGELISMAGEFSPEIDISTEPSISPENAVQTALNAIAKAYGGETASYSATQPELWIFDERLVQPSDRPAELVWRMEVEGTGDVPVRALVLVDAQQGWVSLQFNQIDTFWSSALLGTGNDDGENFSRPKTVNQFSGTVPRQTYTANNGTSLPGTLLCDSADPNCEGGGADPDAVLAHAYAGDTYAFYYDQHGRDSIDDLGMTLVSTVHYDFEFYNAFWNGAQMVYGDGYGFARADDVVAHELTHGVTDYTSNLLYYYQSGAINESFSDLWGEFVDLTNGSGSDDPADRWLAGEDIFGLGAIRSMSDPTIYGDPDKMTSGNYYTDEFDNGGVHYNSGVNNKAVYLMVDGDTFNGYVVSGIGLDKVAAIYYLTQTTLLTSGSNYYALYYAVNQACQTLIGGAEGITAGDCEEVNKALLAVEMNQEPYAGFNPEAGVCPAGSSQSVLFYDDFESGPTANWSKNIVLDSVGANTSWGWAAGYATSGLYDYWGWNMDAEGAMYTQLQTGSVVSLPTTTNPLYLRFNHSFEFEWYNTGQYYDGGILEYSVSGGAWTDANSLIVDGRDYTGVIELWGGGNPYEDQFAFVGPSHGYVSSRYDLSAFNGNTINFRWTVATDEMISAFGWDIDDVTFYQCVTPVLTAPSGTITEISPTFEWNEDGGNTTQYQLVVNDSGGEVFSEWYNTSAICSGGTCSVTPSLFLNNGDYNWSVRGMYQLGEGEWTTPVDFTVNSSIQMSESLTNTSFESNVPAYWREGDYVEPGDGPDCGAGNVNSGDCALVLHGNGAQKRVFSLNPYTANAGDEFTLSLYRKGADVPSEAHTYANIILFYTDGTRETFNLWLHQGNLDVWEQRSITVTAAKDVKRYNLNIFYKKASGSIWVDDISVSHNGGANMVDDPSFESWKPNEWMLSENFTPDDGPACTPAEVYSGTCSLRFVGDGTSKRLLMRVREAGSAGDVLNFSVLRKGANLPVGAAYANVILVHTDGSLGHNILWLHPGDSSVWEQRLMEITAEKDYKWINLNLFYKKDTGTIWLDDISLLIPTTP